MHLTVYRQSEIFYFAFIVGLIIGLYYDFYRLLRYIGFKSKYAVIAQDIIFMSTTAVLCFLYAEITVNGHMRGFVMFAHLFGVLSYRYSIGLLSGIIFKLTANVLAFIKNIFEKIFNCLLLLIRNIYDKLSRIYHKTSAAFVKNSADRKKFKIN